MNRCGAIDLSWLSERRRSPSCLALVAALGLAVPAAAQTPALKPRPGTTSSPTPGAATCSAPSRTCVSLEKLRFVTDSDYPPFHYFDEEGVLTGFNVDLAKAICEALEVQCEVRPVEWEDLFAALDKRRGRCGHRLDQDRCRHAGEGRPHQPLLCDAGAFHRAQGQRAQGHPSRDRRRQEDRGGQGHRSRGLRPALLPRGR